MHAHDALLLVTPEYNALPHAAGAQRVRLDVAHPGDGRRRRPGWRPPPNKPAALLSASPGPLGGLRSMNLLRQYLQGDFQMIVVPQQFALGRAGEAFDEAGALKDAKSQQIVEGVLTALGDLATALKAR